MAGALFYTNALMFSNYLLIFVVPNFVTQK